MIPCGGEEERQEDLANLDYADYAWIWEGAYLETQLAGAG